MQNWGNIYRVHLKSTADGYPIIKPETYVPMDNWIGLNEVLTYKGDKSKTGVHFYLDDYQFERVYTQPKKWIEELSQFGAVLSPDFSAYTDFPKPIQLYNKFRNQWCGALWQKYGIRVYPSIMWTDRTSFSWCFDGIPVNNVIAISNVGLIKNTNNYSGFMLGYKKAINILKPKKILIFGTDMELSENVDFIKIGGFHG